MPLFGPSRKEIWRKLSEEIGPQYVEGGLWKGDKVVAEHGVKATDESRVRGLLADAAPRPLRRDARSPHPDGRGRSGPRQRTVEVT
jgi:hypothetical protein